MQRAQQLKLNIVSRTYDGKFFLKKPEGHSNQKDTNIFSYRNVWARDLFIYDLVDPVKPPLVALDSEVDRSPIQYIIVVYIIIIYYIIIITIT